MLEAFGRLLVTEILVIVARLNRAIDSIEEVDICRTLNSKLHGVDAQIYFADVLFKLVNLRSASRLDEPIPWTWAAERSLKRAALIAGDAKIWS
jgi:hypothetical protein